MKIESINSQHLTNALHLQFANETKSKIEKFNPSVLKHYSDFSDETKLKRLLKPSDAMHD